MEAFEIHEQEVLREAWQEVEEEVLWSLVGLDPYQDIF